MIVDNSESRRTLESLSTAVLLCDTALNVCYMNPSAESLLAVSLRRMRGQPLTSAMVDLDDGGSAQAFRDTVASGHPFTKREAHIRVGLREMVVDYSVTLMQAPGNRTQVLIEIQPRDRLLRIAREEAMLASHQATRKLVRGVAHEIKNPLGGIRGAAQLLASELSDPELEEYTSIIIGEADRLRLLADRMLGSRKLPRKQSVNIHECLERVAALLEAEAAGKVTVNRDYDPSLPEIEADPDQLIQALLNVGGNALQALLEQDGHPSPTITLRTRPVRQFTIGSRRHRVVLRIDVADNGPGIPPEIRASIFYPMVSGRANGTGLGLSIAQDIIHSYDGLIECESAPGSTVFSLYLPLERRS